MLVFLPMKERLLYFFRKVPRLRPRAPLPEMKVEFYAFANINNTIRLREGKLLVRLSDLLEGAPEPVFTRHCPHSSGEDVPQAD